MPILAVLLALALQTPTKTAPADELAALVPKNTVACIEAPSLERAAHFVHSLIEGLAMHPPPAENVAQWMALLDLPGDPALVDPARPIAVCVHLDESPEAQPAPMFLVPVRDAAKYVESLAQNGARMKGVAKGSYACVYLAQEPEFLSAPAEIARGLPAGEISARLDLARLIEQYRAVIDGGLEQLEAQAGAAGGPLNTAPLLELYVDGIRDVLDSAQTLELCTRLEGERLELGFALTTFAGSPLASFASKEKTDVRSLARYFDSDAALGALLGLDMSALMKRFQPMLDVLAELYPEPLRPSMKQAFAHVFELYPLMGSAQSASVDFAGGGMRYSACFAGADPHKLLEAQRKLMRGFPGVSTDDLPPRTLEGFEVAGFHVRFDFDAVTKTLGQPDASPARKQEAQAQLDRLFGKEGLAIEVASKDGLCALVVGGDEAALQSVLARLTSKSAAPPLLARALAEVGDLNPCFVLRYDLGNLMKGMQELVPGAASLFQAVPLTLLVWGGVDGPVWRGGIASSLSEIRALAQSPPKPKPRGPTSARADITAILAALDEYAINNSGHYPQSLEPLVTPDANGNKYLEWPGEGNPKDPWGREYVYELPREGHPRPRVYSLGRDGKPGGTGEDADIDSDKP